MRRTMLVMAALCVAVATLAGCGDDEGAATTAPAETTAATTTAAPATTAPPATAAPATTDGPAPPPNTEVPAETMVETEEPQMALFSSDFDDEGDIPVEFSCDGANLVPDLRWDRFPPAAVSLALTVIDPDGGDWIHWIAWNIPPDAGGFAGDVPGGDLPDGTRQAENDYSEVLEAGDQFPGGGTLRINGWDGPCPGPQPHRYVFTLYALTGTIDLPTGSPGLDVLAAIEDARGNGSLIGEVSITGMYPAG